MELEARLVNRLEHLLLALLDEPDAVRVMQACSVDMDELRSTLLEFINDDLSNLVTDIVRKNGVSGNWVWWAFLLTGMLTVFIYARLWRRSGALTDIEFYELRYSGRSAAFLRGFRALYLGFFFNVIIIVFFSFSP